jgi:uncharacterized protein YdhG (YjbR/CyaY superfamily)
MTKTQFESVDEYIAAQPQAVQRVRRIIRMAVPDVEESIGYQIAAYKLHGRPVLFVAGWKQHYSLYPASPRVLEQCASELAAYKISKGTIRFPLSAPIPVKLIERIAKLRAQEAGEHAPPKRRSP